MKRDSFVFYTSWLKGIEGLTEANQAAIVFALIRYAAYGEEPNTDNAVVKMAFAYAKPQIDANNKRYLASKKGGAPKGNHNNPQGRGVSNHRLDNNQPNVDVNADEYVNEDVYAYKNEKESGADGVEAAESGPTNLEGVTKLLQMNSLRVDPLTVFNHFERMKWQVNGIPIVDWESVVLNYAEKLLGI